MKSCIVTSTSLDDEIQSLAANIRTLEDDDSSMAGIVAGRLALEFIDKISVYIHSRLYSKK